MSREEQPTEGQDKTTTKTCPRCDGYGEVDVYPGGGFALNPGNRPSGTMRCSTCKGTGKIEGP
jgi:hypothetical protein